MSRQPFANPFFDSCCNYFEELQLRIVQSLEELEGDRSFVREAWDRPPLPPQSEINEDLERPILGGHGLTCVLEDGDVFEKAGVNFSDVKGYFPSSYASTMPGDTREFRASGVSLVIHPANPYVPTIHMNIRRIQRGSNAWFGGGADLTPYYLDEQDARRFHHIYKEVCDKHEPNADYSSMKQECDDYFFIPHRDEARGIGGIFFDYLDSAPDDTFAFVKDVGDAFLDAYIPIVRKHMNTSFGERQRQWQLYRRGRYVEFNLVYDRGTTFGLKTGGRIESILMSLPRNVMWKYDHHPEPGSPEAALLEGLKPRDWAAEYSAANHRGG